MIELRDVTKIFNSGQPNEFTAVRGVTLALNGCLATTFTGPSGSGKTTLLSLIGCMARPTSGRIVIDGDVISSLPERFLTEVRRRTFGFIFQQFNLIRGLTARENVMLPAYPTGAPLRRIRGEADRLLDAAGTHPQGRGQGRVAVRRRGAARGDRPGADQQPVRDHCRRADGAPGHRVVAGLHGDHAGAPRRGQDPASSRAMIRWCTSRTWSTGSSACGTGAWWIRGGRDDPAPADRGPAGGFAARQLPAGARVVVRRADPPPLGPRERQRVAARPRAPDLPRLHRHGLRVRLPGGLALPVHLHGRRPGPALRGGDVRRGHPLREPLRLSDPGAEGRERRPGGRLADREPRGQPRPGLPAHPPEVRLPAGAHAGRPRRDGDPGGLLRGAQGRRDHLLLRQPLQQRRRPASRRTWPRFPASRRSSCSTP